MGGLEISGETKGPDKAILLYPGNLIEIYRTHRQEIEAISDPLALFLLKLLEYQRKGSQDDLSRQLDELTRLVKSNPEILTQENLVLQLLRRISEQPDLLYSKLDLLTEAGFVTNDGEKLTATLLGKSLLHDTGLTLKRIEESVPSSEEEIFKENEIDKSIDQITYALATVDFLSDPLLIGSELKITVLGLCWQKKIAQAIDSCRELSQVGQSAKDTFVQGVAVFLLGAVYFALGGRGNDWDIAGDYYMQSTRFFHNFVNENHEHNEGVAWLALARLREKQCLSDEKNKWSEAIEAYSNAIALFEQGLDQLAKNAIEARTNLVRKFREHPPYKSIQQANLKGWVSPTIAGTAQTGQKKTSGPELLEIKIGERKTSRFLKLITLAGFLLLGLGGWFLILRTEPVLTFGSLFSAFALLVVPFLTILIANQMFYTLQLEDVAIVEYGERIWTQTYGHKFLLPFVEHLDAIFSISLKQFTMPPEKFRAKDGFSVEVRLGVKYHIADPLLVWNVISLAIKPRSLLGVRYPVSGKEIFPILETRIQEELKSLLSSLVVDTTQRIIFGKTNELEKYLANELTKRTRVLGLLIDRIEIFLRYV